MFSSNLSMSAIPTEFIPANNGITLYTAGTPNGLKITLALELLGIPYKLCVIDRLNYQQKEPWYLQNINPLGLIPVLFDVISSPDEPVMKIFESGAILQYLADQYDQAHKISYPKGTSLYYESLQLLFHQLCNVESAQVPASSYIVYHSQPGQPFPPHISNCISKTRYFYKSLENQLIKSATGYLVGPHISIADIAVVSWILASPILKISLETEFPVLKKWTDLILTGPGALKGLRTPELLPNYLKYVKLPEL